MLILPLWHLALSQTILCAGFKLGHYPGLPQGGKDDLVLEPGLVALSSPCGLNEAMLEPIKEEEEPSEDTHDSELLLDEH
jgi:hypothetical protein